VNLNAFVERFVVAASRRMPGHSARHCLARESRSRQFRFPHVTRYPWSPKVFRV
jgi:hypothetical protein